MTEHDEPANGHEPQEEPAPQLLPVGRAVSLAGILERIEAEFNAETEGRIDLFADADEMAQRAMIRDVADYVLAVESIKLSPAERLTVLERLYNDLFSFGPLQPHLADPTVTQIKITGHDRVYIRQGMGAMAPIEAQFDNPAHLERVVGRALAGAGTQLGAADPFLEVGVTLAGRPVRLTVTGPPISPALHVDMRLHPSEPVTLPALIEVGMLEERAAVLLRAILTAGHGLMIVGDVDTGKTALLQALLPVLPAGSLAVERARELRVPDTMQQIAAIPPGPGREPVEFAEQITAALAERPAWLVLDEVRFDESAAMWAALAAPDGPRCLWAFRGAVEPLRLHAAFSMAVRRAHNSIAQDVIHSALLGRLPFAALLARQGERRALIRICEWQRERADLSRIALRQIWPAEGVAPLHALDWSAD